MLNYGVILGNGNLMKGKGMCKGVLLEMQGLRVVEYYFPLQTKSTNVIMGVKWLALLGVPRDDWHHLTMEFEVNGKVVTLRGDPFLCKSLVCLKT